MQCIEQILLLIESILPRSAKQGKDSTVLVGRAAAFGPEQDRGVTYTADMILVGQEGIQRRGVGKGCIFAGGGIGTLFVFVGTERWL